MRGPPMPAKRACPCVVFEGLHQPRAEQIARSFAGDEEEERRIRHRLDHIQGSGSFKTYKSIFCQ